MTADPRRERLREVLADSMWLGEGDVGHNVYNALLDDLLERLDRAGLTGRNALTRLHDKVRQQLAASSQSERDATQDGRKQTANGHALQVDALDWALQRIDEEMNQ